MKFEIMNRVKAREYAQTAHPETSAIISINTPCDLLNFMPKNERNNIRDVLYLFFYDSEKGEEPICGEPINLVQARQIAGFVQWNVNRVDKFIVHCDAGVSRSAGVCAAIMKWMTGSDEEVFGNPQYYPNMTCYRLVLAALMESGKYER